MGAGSCAVAEGCLENRSDLLGRSTGRLCASQNQHASMRMVPSSLMRYMRCCYKTKVPAPYTLPSLATARQHPLMLMLVPPAVLLLLPSGTSIASIAPLP
jgi:hypothetical protein